MNVGKIDRTVMKALDMVEKLEKLFANNGAFENAVLKLEGDISWFSDVRKDLNQLYGNIEELHMGAVGHLDESITESVKLTEGVLDDTDDDGFMARSQLYFLAKDAIALHGMIDDRDNLEPWVQSKIATAAEGMDAVRRYTEYNAMKQDSQLPVPVDAPEDDMNMEETVVIEAEERPYVCVHAKKGKHECHAATSYEAAKKAAAHWKLKSTAGIDAHLADVEHTATESVAEGKKKQIDRNGDGKNDWEDVKLARKAAAAKAQKKPVEEELKVVAQDMFKNALSAAKKRAQ